MLNLFLTIAEGLLYRLFLKRLYIFNNRGGLLAGFCPLLSQIETLHLLNKVGYRAADALI